MKAGVVTPGLKDNARVIDMEKPEPGQGQTSFSDTLPLSGALDGVAFLTVHPGFCDKQLTPEVLERVVEFRSTRPDTEMGIDGGAKDSTIARVVRFGVDVIYVGGVPYY